MRKVEKVQKVIDVKETTAVFCDHCKKQIVPILPESCRYNFFTLSTYKFDYGDDEGTFEHWDACSIECAIALANEYLSAAHKHGTDNYSRTRSLEIELATNLSASRGDTFSNTIAEAAD